MVDEMNRRIGHAPTATRRAERPGFARERDDAIHAAFTAVNPHKTSRQNTAIKKRAQVAFYKPGNHTFALLLLGQKRLDVFGHPMIKNAPLRTARLIFKSGFADVESLARK